MRITILGAGLLGTCSAWYLARAGHQVSVIERQPGPALETSYANAGQISVSHAEPWGAPGTPGLALRWMFREDSPLLFRLRADLAQWRWALALLRECTPERYARNVAQLAALGLYSRQSLRELRLETGVRYDQLSRGILHYYTDPAALDAAVKRGAVLARHGVRRDALSPEEARRLEPVLGNLGDRLAGATYTADDESGDARKFTAALAERCETLGVRFRYRTVVDGFECDGARVRSVRLTGGERLSGDAWVLAAGSHSRTLAARAGLRLPVYPVKGYSVTVPITHPERAPVVSLTDEAHKVALSRLGDRLRIAGTAEFNGDDTSINPVRCQTLMRLGQQLAPDACDWRRAEFWAGLRPATPSNVPLIGRSALSNLWLNTGHGTLGWTHACGSGRALAELMSGRPAPIAFDFLTG